jgi:hypothetical protein
MKQVDDLVKKDPLSLQALEQGGGQSSKTLYTVLVASPVLFALALILFILGLILSGGGGSSAGTT